MTADLLVSLVGLNPVSALVCARAVNPRRLLLVATEESKAVAGRLARLVPGDAVISEGDANPGIDALVDALAEEIAACLPEPSARICLDITGATKPLSIAAWLACARHRARDFEAIYLERDGRLVSARDAAPLAVSVIVEPSEFVALRGGQVVKARWSGSPAEVPADILARRTAGQTLFAAVSSRRARPSASVDRVAAGRADLPPNYLGKNEWLEELCLLVAAGAAGTDPGVRAALGCSVRAENGGNDEIDVVLTRGSRAVVIEAKTNVADAGTVIRDRESKVRELVDAHAHLVFVCPYWANKPPGKVPRAPTTHLVGGDLAELARVVGRGLGL